MGITEIDRDEVIMKQAMMARCVHTVFLIDGSKWGQVAPYTITSPQDIRHIITSDDAPPDLVHRLRQRGIRVDVADVVE
jgi:DeoR/GlpR family transcriptional regulator of sugar metabolism